MKKHALAKRFPSVEWLDRLLLAIALLVLGRLAARPLIRPSAGPASADGRFSADRAMEDLRVVAREPHAAGSEAQAWVRDYCRVGYDLLRRVAAAQSFDTCPGMEYTANYRLDLPASTFLDNGVMDDTKGGKYDTRKGGTFYATGLCCVRRGQQVCQGPP